ncbi:S8 family serine peptidase, partial [bacterium]|nr:S8 family serine peptidase [bacterium]
FQMSSTGSVSIETRQTNGQEPMDTVIQLFGPDDSQAFLMQDDDGGEELFSKISKTLDGGHTYFVKVFGNIDATGFYSIDVRTVVPTPTPTHTPTNTPTPTEPPYTGDPEIRIEPVSLYFTNGTPPPDGPTPAPGEPTPAPAANVVVVNDHVETVDDLSNSFDVDRPNDEELIIRWKLDIENVLKYHIYVIVDNNGKPRKLGQTDPTDKTPKEDFEYVFRWNADNKWVEGPFKKGPQTGHDYQFGVYAIVKGGKNEGRFWAEGPVHFEVNQDGDTLSHPSAFVTQDTQTGNGGILLKSGTIDTSVDSSNNDVYSAAKRSALGGKTETYHALLQFKRIPTEAEKEALAGQGIELIQYIPHNAYWASIQTSSVSLRDVETGGGIVWSRASNGVNKLDAEVAQGQFPLHAIREDGRVEVDVLVFDDVPSQRASQNLAQLGGELVDVVGEDLYRVAVDASMLPHIGSLDIVEWVDAAMAPKHANNVVSAQRIYADDIQALPYELNGKDVVVGVWDEGPAFFHTDFGSRLMHKDTSSISNHATHVAGTIGGSGALRSNAKGMAFGGTIHSYDWYSDWSEMRNAETQGVRLSNHSYGLIVGWYYSGGKWVDWGNSSKFGSYSYTAQGYDSVVYDTDLIVFKSAGNDRNDGPSSSQKDGPYDCIPPGGIAKNLITIGATDDNDGMSYFSSWGPADDGRVKPDLVANGVGLYSTLPNNSYGSYSGTSMSSPSACGSASLLYQLYMNELGERPAAATMKALLIHGARDIGRTGPDYVYGWGIINAKTSADLIKERMWKENTAAQGSMVPYQVAIEEGEVELKATLVWKDRPGSPSSQLALVNNLDLQVKSPSGVTYHPWILDKNNPEAVATKGVNQVDNVEQVLIPNPEPGIWTIEVAGTSVPQGPQPFTLVSESLVANNNSKSFKIYNDGEGILTINSLALNENAKWLSFTPEAPFDIIPGEDRKVTVNLNFAAAPIGNVTRQLVVMSNDADESPYPGGVWINADVVVTPTPIPTNTPEPTL